jgi:heterodisulfide reductase subunit A2
MTDHTNDAQTTVLVIGGGVGGIKAAMDLSEAQKDVLLVDKAAAIGGLMTQLDRTFPTNNCDLCTISPHLSAGARQQHIELMPLTQVTGVTGEAGDFTVTLTSMPRYIDLEKCTACGECHKKFPEWVRIQSGSGPSGSDLYALSPSHTPGLFASIWRPQGRGWPGQRAARPVPSCHR